MKSDIPILILAAGKSSRLGKVSQLIKKYYLPITSNDTILSRLVDQSLYYTNNVFVAVNSDDNTYEGLLDEGILDDRAEVLRVLSSSPNNSVTVNLCLDSLYSRGYDKCIIISGDTILGNIGTTFKEVYTLFDFMEYSSNSNSLLVGSRLDEDWRVEVDYSNNNEILDISTDGSAPVSTHSNAILGVYKVDIPYYLSKLSDDMFYFDDVYVDNYKEMDIGVVFSTIPIYEVDTFDNYIKVLNDFRR